MRLLPSLILATKAHNTIDERVADIGSVLSWKSKKIIITHEILTWKIATKYLPV